MMERFPDLTSRKRTPFKALLVLGCVVLMGNLNAMIDSVLHPEIPYFDEEHLIVGTITALMTLVLFAVIAVNTRGLRIAAEEWQSTFDTIGDAVSIHDGEMNIVKANRSACSLLGVESPAGKKCYSLFHGSDAPPGDCPMVRSMKSRVPESFEVFEGRFGRWLSVSCFPLFDPRSGKAAGTVHVARDITEQKQTEQEIFRLNEELVRKIDERTGQLLDAQEELVRSEKMAVLGQLSAAVGHELRNPLGVINNAVYFLKTVLPGADEEVKEYLDIIGKEVFNSQRIVSDLLDFSQTRTPRVGEIGVTDVINHSLTKCTIPPEVTVIVDVPETLPPVSCDPLQMEQVIQNLVTNAVQAMPDGGTLRIVGAKKAYGSSLVAPGDRKSPHSNELSAMSYEPDEDFIEISVSDTGEGIMSENVPRIFQPLYTTKARGIGLGLAVSKKLVEANGGRIEVKSELGKGTTFVVMLPVEDVAKETDREPV
jgi:PAS domain S-box-containing protein